MDGDSAFGPVERRLWLISGVVAAGLIILLVQLWIAKNSQVPETSQLFNDTKVEEFLSDPRNWASRDDLDEQGMPTAQEIPTGVFIQSLRFLSATDVHMTGYVWQQFPSVSPLSNEEFPIGFILPELVDSSVGVRLEYRVEQGGGEVVGWYFEGTVRQPFEYRDYPFDHKTVWLKIWPKDFSANTVLVPDLGAYDATGAEDRFGVEESIVLGEWDREDTYFDYDISKYTTNFGIVNYVGQGEFPELRYNMLIKRRLQSAFIVNLVPLFVVAMLAFAALMTTTQDKKRVAIFGFSTAGSIGTLSALFFVVLLAHIQLRQLIPGSGVVYMVWFYFMMYVVLLGVAVNTYVVSAPWSAGNRVVKYRDNLIPKVTYWPVLIAAMVVITIVGF